MKIKTVSFLFAARKNPLSIGCFLLRWFEAIPFSHCAVEIDGFVYESVFPKSHAVLAIDWYETYDLIYHKTIKVDDMTANRIKSYLRRNMMGKWYSFGQITAMFIGMTVNGLSSYIKKTTWNGSKYLVCTELVAKVAHRYFGVEFDQKLDTISLTEAYEKIGDL